MLFRTRIELSGRIYEINNFMCGYTYTNQVFGEPNIQINQYILNTTNPPDDWLRFKKFRIEVTEECINTLLPEYFYHACILSNPFSSENAGSGCILTWFAEAPHDKSINQLISKALQQINWKLCAEDYDFS